MSQSSNISHIDSIGEILESLTKEYNNGNISNIVVSFLSKDGQMWSTHPTDRSFMEQVALVKVAEHNLFHTANKENEDEANIQESKDGLTETKTESRNADANVPSKVIPITGARSITSTSDGYGNGITQTSNSDKTSA